MEVISTDSVAAMTAIDSNQTGGFGVRFGARLIDMVVGTIIGLFAGAFAGMVLGILAATGSVDPDWVNRVQQGSFLQSMYWGLLATVLAESVSESIAGATLGKLILGYRVITSDLQPCTPQAALIRSLGYFVDSFFFGLPAYQSMQNSSHNQRIGDKWANTLVVKAAAIPASAKRTGGLVAFGIIAGLIVHGMVIAMSVVSKAM